MVGGIWGRGEVHTQFVGKPEGRNQLDDPGVDGRIILNRVFKLQDGEL